MKKSRYTEEQIIGSVREADARMPIRSLYRKDSFSDVTFHNWRAKCSRIQISEPKRLRNIEGREHPSQTATGRRSPEDGRTQKRIRHKTLTPQAKHQAIRQMIAEFDLSERWACPLVGLFRVSCRNPAVMKQATKVLSPTIMPIAKVHCGFGYGHIHDLLRPAFPGIDHKQLYRLYSETNLAVRKCKKAKRRINERVALQLVQRVNEVWSMILWATVLAMGSTSSV